MWACMLYEDKEKEMDFVYPTDTTQEYKYYTENGSIWQQHHGTGEKPMVGFRLHLRQFRLEALYLIPQSSNLTRYLHPEL